MLNQLSDDRSSSPVSPQSDALQSARTSGAPSPTKSATLSDSPTQASPGAYSSDMARRLSDENARLKKSLEDANRAREAAHMERARYYDEVRAARQNYHEANANLQDLQQQTRGSTSQLETMRSSISQLQQENTQLKAAAEQQSPRGSIAGMRRLSPPTQFSERRISLIGKDQADMKYAALSDKYHALLKQKTEREQLDARKMSLLDQQLKQTLQQKVKLQKELDEKIREIAHTRRASVSAMAAGAQDNMGVRSPDLSSPDSLNGKSLSEKDPSQLLAQERALRKKAESELAVLRQSIDAERGARTRVAKKLDTMSRWRTQLTFRLANCLY